MRKIEFRRHALKVEGDKEDMLSDEGLKQARRVGAEEMRGKGYTHVMISEKFRTMQTYVAMAEGAGDLTPSQWAMSGALYTARTQELLAYTKECGMAVKPEHPLIKAESRRMAEDFAAYIATLPADAHVLAIGHSPLLEILAFGLTGKVINPLRECEKFELDDTQFQRGLVFDGDLPL